MSTLATTTRRAVGIVPPLGFRKRWGTFFSDRTELRSGGEILRTYYEVRSPDGRTVYIVQGAWPAEYVLREDWLGWENLTPPMSLEDARRAAVLWLATSRGDDRVAKLRRMTEANGCTPEEAATAALLIERLEARGGAQ